MDFLNTLFLDNPIKSYGIVGGIILLMLLLKRYLSRYIAAVLFRVTRRIWKNLEKKSFTDLVVEPLEWMLLTVIAIFSIDKLNFPSDWHYTVYGHSTEQILDRTGIGVIIIVFTWFLLRIIDFIAGELEKKAAVTADKSDDQLIIFFRDFLKAIIVLLGLLLLIKACLNQPIGNLLTSLSIVGAVLALAARESLENLIASFIIFFDKPFTTGDLLKVQAVTGTVEKIGLRSTRIRTLDKTLVTVPNKQMVDSIVDNWSLRVQRRAEIRLELKPTTTGTETRRCLTDIRTYFENHREQFTNSSVQLTELSASGLVLLVEYFTPPVTIEDFNHLKEEVMFGLKKILEDNQVEWTDKFNWASIPR